MDELQKYIAKYKKVAWIIFSVYMVFNSCFVFPLKYENLSMIIISYGIIAAFFMILLNENKNLKVFILSLIFSILGLICRYFLEFGELSNIKNFTSTNIGLFVVIVPIFCMTTYWSICKIQQKNIEGS